MNSNQKFWSGIIIGAAAGAALALLLNSDKGKEILADAKDSADKLGKDIKKKIEGLESEFKALLAKGKVVADELENKATETIIS